MYVCVCVRACMHVHVCRTHSSVCVCVSECVHDAQQCMRLWAALPAASEMLVLAVCECAYMHVRACMHVCRTQRLPLKMLVLAVCMCVCVRVCMCAVRVQLQPNFRCNEWCVCMCVCVCVRACMCAVRTQLQPNFR